MKVTIAVRGAGDGTEGALYDLVRWLRRDPHLRRTIGPGTAPPPPAGTMGASGELVTLLLAPGGLTAALAAAVVAWLQNRRGNQTITITLPDGTQLTVSSERVRGLHAQAASQTAQSLAEALQTAAARTAAPQAATGSGAVAGADTAAARTADGTGPTADRGGAAARQSATGSGAGDPEPHH